jgi:oxygen-independent coproporphyrinogen-3 oxidase
MDAAHAWREISGPICAQMPSSPISIYIHVPFCDRKCDFCDCYSIPLEHSDEQRFGHFTIALLNEIRAWARLPQLRERPVTTIHFGGGTPTFLPIECLRIIINALKHSFKIDPSTEIAFESTSTQLSPALFAFFREAGIARLHVGVQTLDDPIRKRAGRKEQAAVVEEKLRMALGSGLVLTVDVIYGLPGQTISGLVDTLTRLNSLGVHGFSLYRLNLTTHNQPFAREHALGERNLTELFFFFQIAEALLRSWNYRKTHFAHFSKPPDRYLYYRHTYRGEDLLALGPSADGVFGSLHYRHPEMRDYLQATTGDSPALMGAAWETAAESRLQPAISSIMTSSLKRQTFKQLGADHLMDNWINEGLLVFDESQDAFGLTAAGSWLISDILAELI